MRAAGRAVDVDFALLALEAEQEPFLRLPAVTPAETAARAVRQIVGEPIRRLGDERRRAHVGFLEKLAAGGGERVLAGVDAALRHLPFAAGGKRDVPLPLAAADEHVASRD